MFELQYLYSFIHILSDILWFRDSIFLYSLRCRDLHIHIFSFSWVIQGLNISLLLLKTINELHVYFLYWKFHFFITLQIHQFTLFWELREKITLYNLKNLWSLGEEVPSYSKPLTLSFRLSMETIGRKHFEWCKYKYLCKCSLVLKAFFILDCETIHSP